MTMNMETRYAHHPDDVKRYDTQALRRHFLVEQVFVTGELRLTYTHVDRMVFGGAVPTSQTMSLRGGKAFGSDNFLDRRELGVVNIGAGGKVTVDGTVYALANGDGLYVGLGNASVAFDSDNPAQPAKFYLVSCSAHTPYPTVHILRAKASPRKLGAPETCNVRTIYQYINPAVCKSCQLAMGVTVLEPGSVWNTYPPHTHERRMEVYMYFDMAAQTRVFHLMGQPGETRHIVMANEQAVISPSWSIHSGVGSGAYSFIWGMAGENQTFDDMDTLGPNDLI